MTRRRPDPASADRSSRHRRLARLSGAFVAVHVAPATADPFVPISIAAAVVPFVSASKPFWLGLGAVCLDLIIALIVTSLARARIGRRTWRAVHWLAYACWPLAMAHSIGSSTDMRNGGLLALAVGCTAAVVAAARWRIGSSAPTPQPAPPPAHPLAPQSL